MTEPLTVVSGTYVVREGRARLRWERPSPTAWRLATIWPSAEERRRIRRAIASGRSLLVVEGGAEERVDVYQEEVSTRSLAAVRVLESDRGVVTLRLSSSDWLPDSVASSASQFIAEHVRLNELVGIDHGAVLTPAFGPRRNVRVLRFPSAASARITASDVASLADLAFPRKPPYRRSNS